jgi:hypothetical protein
MAIQSLDQLLSASPGYRLPFMKTTAASQAAGRYHSLRQVAGQPGAGGNPPTGNGEIPIMTTAGGIVFPAPSGTNVNYLAQAVIAGSVQGTLMLYDRLWHNSGLSGSATTAQTWTQASLTRHSDGLGVEMWMEIYSALGVTSVTATATYTNNNNVSDRLATTTIPASTVTGQMIPFALAAGDMGIRSTTQVLLSATTGAAGNFGIVLLKRIADIPLNATNVAAVMDTFTIGMPDINTNAHLCAALLCTGTSTGIIHGTVQIVQG